MSDVRTIKTTILNAIDDSVSDLLYYDRKADEDLPQGAIEKAIADGKITIHDMTEMYWKKLHEGMGMPVPPFPGTKP